MANSHFPLVLLSLLCSKEWVVALCYCDNIISCQFNKKRDFRLHKTTAIMHTEQLNALIFHASCFLCRSSRRFGSVGKCHYSPSCSADDASVTMSTNTCHLHSTLERFPFITSPFLRGKRHFNLTQA